MKNTFRRLWLAGLVAFPLAACNQTTASLDPVTTGSIASPASLSASAYSVPVPIPGGAGCRGEINRYKTVTNGDMAMGQVGQADFDQINREINTAELACQSGREAESLQLVTASKARHGYL